MLLSSPIPNLVNGISQQPPSLRLASQAEAQEDFYSSVAEGLKRRPGTRHRAKLTGEDWSTSFLHTMNRDRTERYRLVIRNGGLKVFDLLTGTERTVNAPDGLAYLTATSKKSFRAITVADYTFIVNRERTIAMAPQLTTARLPQALVSITAANYAKTFKVFIDDVERASFTTPNGANAADVAQIATSYIATQLYNQLVANLPAGAEWSVTRDGGSIHIVNQLGNAFDIRTEDDWNGIYMKAISDRVQRFSDLPSQAPAGFTTEVVGEANSSFDNYYVRWDAEEGSENSGVWKETVKWSIPQGFDRSTMPHVLVRESDGTFTFKQAEWSTRGVGDEGSAPEPSFVGASINDVYFLRNRLGFISGENVIMSRTGEFFTFWPKTVTTQLDTDPIDVAVSHVKVSTLNHAVPFNGSLLLFSSQTQFTLSGGDILSPATVNIEQTTEFEGSPDVRPSGAGPNVYFPVSKGEWTGLREYYVEEQGASNNANDVTSHAPKYVPGDVDIMTSSSNEDILLLHSEREPNRLYVYKYYYGEEGKLQSSWSRWNFTPGSRILDAAFIETTIYLFIQRPDGVYMEDIDAGTGAVDEGTDLLYHVDRKLYEDDLPAPDYDGTFTTWTLPYPTEEDMWVFIRAGDASRPEGYVITHDRPLPTTVRARGDYRTSKICFGTRYTSRYTFSTFHIKEEAVGGGQASISEGRLQVLYLSLDYNRSGYFKVTVTPAFRDTYEYNFTGRILGAGNAVLGTASLETGRFKVPVLSKNDQVTIEIVSDHFLPCSFMSAEWEARYTARTRRL